AFPCRPDHRRVPLFRRPLMSGAVLVFPGVPPLQRLVLGFPGLLLLRLAPGFPGRLLLQLAAVFPVKLFPRQLMSRAVPVFPGQPWQRVTRTSPVQLSLQRLALVFARQPSLPMLSPRYPKRLIQLSPQRPTATVKSPSLI